MSRWSVWQIGRGGAPERVGTYTSGADARRVLRSAIPRGAAVDPDAEVSEARGVSPAHVTAIEAAAEAWLATAEAPTMPAPPEVIEIPEPAFEPPVVEHVVPYAERAAEVRVERVLRAMVAAMESPLDEGAAPVVELRVDDSVRALALDEYAERTTAAEAFAVQAEKDLTVLREQIDQERAQVRALTAERDGLRIALDDARAQLARRPAKIVRLAAPPAPKPRRVRKATETPLGTIMRRIDERARGIR
jgi:predicted nucleic acid-binding protein